MSKREYPLRPHRQVFDHAGYQVMVIDGPQLLAAAQGRELEVLRDGEFGPVVREARLRITSDGSQSVLDGAVRIGRGGEPRLSVGGLGRDPLSVLLTWRADAGDPWAVRIVDGVGAMADRVNQRLRPPGAATTGQVIRAVEREDPATGLRATVTLRGMTDVVQVVTLRATVPIGDMTATLLAAMARLIIDVVVEFDGEPTTRRRFTLAIPRDADAAVTLDRVGGLDEVVGRLRQIAVSFRHPDAMARWGARRPQGLLFYGPPGTGKTMLAHALANEIGARFQEIHTPDILDKWLGASERNIKRIFRDARRYTQPTVMLFDEFDSIISYAGDGGDGASQAINAVAGIFKQEMNDLIDANPRVIVVATTNFPDRVDASLIRSGRFDLKLLVPAPDKVARADILAKMIRQLIGAYEVGDFRMFDDDIDVAELAIQSQAMTGADLAEVLRRTQLAKAMHEARSGTRATPINQADLERHVAELRGEALAPRRR